MQLSKRWPLVLIVFGLVLTLIWMATLIAVPLRLLQLV
jgi:hypothetical protein